MFDETARAEKRAYYKAWRAKPENKEKIKKHNAAYWAKRAAKRIAQKEAANDASKQQS